MWKRPGRPHNGRWNSQTVASETGFDTVRAVPAPRSHPKQFFVLINRGGRGELGPLDRIEMSEALRTGQIMSGHRVRNAFGRPLGTVADVLAGVVAGRTSAHGLQPIEDQPAPRSRGPLIIGVVGALVAALALWLSLGGTKPAPGPVVPAAPAEAARPAAPVEAPRAAVPVVAKAVLPDGWSAIDLGDARPKGRAVMLDGTWTVTGGGSDIWNQSDECHVAHKPGPAGVRLSVRLVSAEDTDEWQKAGLMLRTSLAPESPMAAVVATRDRIQFVFRQSPGGTADCVDVPTKGYPVWLRLERRDGMVVASLSTDGTTWDKLGDGLAMPELAGAGPVGLAVCSHNRSLASTAVFDHLEIVPLP